jgi:tRNA(Arg) A34 adenosine deaminase TadA
MILSEQILEKAKRKAHKSACSYRICAVGFDNKGMAISFGVNRPRFAKYAGGRHAEMAALEKGGKQIKSMMVFRVSKGGRFLPIRCCDTCQRILDRYKITVYTPKLVDFQE